MLISGTWIFNETLLWQTTTNNYDAGFSVPNELSTCIEFNLSADPVGEYFSLGYYGCNGGTMSSVIAYDSRTGWVNENMRTIVFFDGNDMSPDGYAWFTANAVPVVTAPQLNPAALMQSFFVGEAAKRCRR